MKLRFFLSVLLLTAPLFAQWPLLEPVAAPAFERAQDGMYSKIDFSLPLDDYRKSGVSFAKFSGKPTLLLYVSATCGHCHRAYPKVSKMVSEYRAHGLEMAVVVSSFSKKSDIDDMLDDLKIKEPFFFDKQKKFGELYGLGSVPMLILVDAQGRYIRIRSFGEDQELQTRNELNRWFEPKK